MSHFLGLLFSAVLVNNLVLNYLVGLDLQVAASQRISAAWLVGLATTYCLSICLPGIYLIEQLLIIPLALEYLALLLYVMLILVIVLASQRMIHRLFPLIYKQIDAVVPVILMNSVLLAVILLQQNDLTSSLGNTFKGNTFFGSFILGLGTGTGFLFLLLVLTCLRERINNENIPEPFKGLPVLLIALAIFSMGLMGLAGLQ